MNAALNEAPCARVINVSEEEYHRDPCEIPSLSQSVARILVTQSPLHAWCIHPKLGQQENEDTDEGDTDAMRDGKVIGRLLLGKGSDIEVIEANDFRTNRAKELRDAATAAGRVPILVHKYAEAAATADILREKLEVEGVVFNGDSEVAFEWDEAGERGPVRCRGRMDHVFTDRGVIYDLKKIRSAHPKMCAKHMTEFGYDIQWAAYTNALAKYRPDLAGRVQMRFVFVEVKPPFDVVVAEPDGVMRELGSTRWRRAIYLWERCLATNRWPGYAQGVVQLSPQPWVVKEWMEGSHADW